MGGGHWSWLPRGVSYVVVVQPISKAMDTLKSLAREYATAAAKLRNAATTSEETFYPCIRDLWSGILGLSCLPFEVRTSTSERRDRGGADRPDVALYDEGDVPVVYGEVKLPSIALEDLAQSMERGDQIGRYLARTGVVILSNIRAFGLLTCKPGMTRDLDSPVPPSARDLRAVVEFWASDSELRRGASVADEALSQLAALLEQAVTEYAPIASPQALAKILARQARAAKGDLPETLDSPTLKPLYDDFRSALGLTFDTDDGVEFFRSSLVQTVFYSLFAGWTLWHRGGCRDRFRWRDIQDYLQLPFIGALFHEIENPILLRELKLHMHLDRAEETLGRVDVDAFFARFSTMDLDHESGGRSQLDAITYFYEPFLEAFDPELREQLGVWFTPPEIVRYQVRRVEQILKNELGCRRGFADERVVVLDPCCGTGAYLLEVARRVAVEISEQGDSSLVGATLADALSSRIIGFEILTAPFVIAQLQLYLLLADLGIESGGHRPAVFLTNALAGWSDEGGQKLNFPELIEERELACGVKQKAKIVVVLGNPPYNRFAGVAMDEEADLVDRYKGIDRKLAKGTQRKVQKGSSALFRRFGIRKQLLDDLYIRFFRLADWRIGEVAEYGVVCFISNSSYLAGRSHPLMRESLLTNFHEVWIDNDNGDKYKTGKVVPKGCPGEGTTDQSVFSSEQDARGIQVGTAISTFLRRPMPPTPPADTPIHYRDFWGKAADKRRALVDSLTMGGWKDERAREAAGQPEGPRPYVTFCTNEKRRFLLTPTSQAGGYEDWLALDELFPTSFQGVNPNRGIDGSVIDVDREALAARMKLYFSAKDFETVRRACPELAARRARYEPEAVWEAVRGTYEEARLVPYLTFPLDNRFIYYETRAKLLNERRPEFWANLLENEFLVAVPQPRRASENLPLLATSLVDLHLHDRGSVCFPQVILDTDKKGKRAANLSQLVSDALKRVGYMNGILESAEGGAQVVKQLMRLALVVMHAPDYLKDHRDALSEDWARLPIPRDAGVLRRIAEAGDCLAVLLNPLVDAEDVVRDVLGSDATALGVPYTLHGGENRQIASSDLVVTVNYYSAAKGGWRERSSVGNSPVCSALGGRTGDLYLNERVYLANVPEAVWRYELGGYPVLKKWLGYREAKRRDGQPLTLRELQHLRSMVQRVSAILVLRDTLDEHYAAAAADAFTVEELGLA